MQFEIAGKTVDLSAAFPLTLGDWVQFDTLGVTDEAGNVKSSPPAILKLVVYLAGKANADVTEEDALTIPLKVLTRTILPAITKQLEAESEDDDAPLPTSSISSPSPMDGASDKPLS